MVRYIVRAERSMKRHGNLAKFYVRNFDSITKKGHSEYYEKNIAHIIPSKEGDERAIEDLLARCRNEFPEINFRMKDYGNKKRLVWAELEDIADKERLPKEFLVDKYSSTEILSFVAPTFMIVDKKGDELIIPDPRDPETKYVDLETVLSDLYCILDIETVDFRDPKKERITNAVLNFKRIGKESEKKVIVSTFDVYFKKYGNKEFNKYEMIYAKNTDELKKEVVKIVKEMDPLMLVGFKIDFDQSKLRDLGKGDFELGTDLSEPVYKSVQGIKNMISRGLFVCDLYGYLFLYYNIRKNNKLETHCGIRKSMDHVILEEKSKKAEKGSIDDALEVLSYVAEDGNMTEMLAENQEYGNNLKKIFSKAIFCRMDPSTICTSSGRNVMKKFWKRKYFWKMNTFKDRYEYRYNPSKFDVENVKDLLLKLKKRDGIFKELHLVYPIVFIRSMWKMIEGTTESLSFDTPEERFNAAQTLNGYISEPLEEYFKLMEQVGGITFDVPDRIKIGKKEISTHLIDYRFLNEYGMSVYHINNAIKKYINMFNELVDDDVINYSKKFIYFLNPEKVVEKKLGFVFGKGPTLCCGKKIVSLINNKLVFQGFGMTRGMKTRFEKDLMESVLEKILHFEDVGKISDFVMQRFDGISKGIVFRHELIYKESGQEFGIINGRKVLKEEFLLSNENPDFEYYKENFRRIYRDILDLAGLNIV